MKGFNHPEAEGKTRCSVKFIMVVIHTVFTWRRYFYIMRKEHQYYFIVLLEIVKYCPKDLSMFISKLQEAG